MRSKISSISQDAFKKFQIISKLQIIDLGSQENGTYWVNPATPQPMCHLMVTRMNSDICQIKLELDVFEIAGPNAKGECAEEFFLVSGGSPVPSLCGVNNHQHVIYR